jgi:transcriptional regulator GlxA family with amidase domain
MHEPSSERFRRHVRLGALINHIQEHPCGLLNLAAAANLFGMERTSFSKYFHRLTGFRYLEFVHAIRIERAKEMLITSLDLNVTQIADAAGFTSISSFERCFKAATGMTPSHYRKRSYKTTA